MMEDGNFSVEELKLEYLPCEILYLTILPYLEPYDLLSLSQTNLWWQQTVEEFVNNFGKRVKVSEWDKEFYHFYPETHLFKKLINCYVE